MQPVWKLLFAGDSFPASGADAEHRGAGHLQVYGHFYLSIRNSFCQAHGYDQTHMGRMLLASNENDDNYTSVGDCGHLLQEIYKQDTSGYTHAADMFNLLKAQTRCNKIPAQLPEGVKTANKTGELDNVENDAGIIYDSKNDVVIVFMSQNLSSAGSAQNTIATLSRTIYDYYN